MKANDVYMTALSFLSEKPQQNDVKKFSLGWLNLLLAEALPYENSVRSAGGQELLPRSPEISDLQEEIPYCEEICKIVLPYGLAEFMFSDDGDLYNAERYRSRYVSALSEVQKYNFGDIEDVYGGEIDG